MSYTCIKVIELFIRLQEGEIGSISDTRTVFIRGNQLIHFNTPIMERTDDGFILNLSRYSIVTSRLQKKIKTILSENYLTVTGVPFDYDSSLKNFLK